MKYWEKRAIDLLTKSLSGLVNEPNELDWKETLSPNKNRLCQHLSAFANNPGGGFLVFGVDNKTSKIVGVDTQEARDIVATLSNLCRNNLTPEVVIDHGQTKYQDQNILLIFVHESSIKPVRPKNGSLESAYIRSGGSTRKVSEAELANLILNSRRPRWEELNATVVLPDFEVLKLLDHYAIFELLKKPVPSSSEEVFTWMEEEKLIKKCQGSGYYITNFGVIAAARNLQDFPDLCRKALRVIHYKGTNKVNTEKEFISQQGYAISFNQIIELLKVSLPQSEIIHHAFREEHTIYPLLALRELIANALIHQDFTIQGTSPMVEVYDDRIEFTSPGLLLASKKIDRLIGTTPESRNEVLAAALRRYNLCEERGSGFIKSVNSIELFGLPPLRFENSENHFKVTLCAPRSFGEMSEAERIAACYQHAVLKYCSGSVMTNKSLRERFKMPEKRRPMISLLIRHALEAEVVKPKNPENSSTKLIEYVPYWG